jgi:flagellin-specific chaperone FliS
VAREVKLQLTAQDKTAAAFNSLNKKLGGLNKSIGASVTKIAKIGAAFGAAGVAAGVALTKASMASVDALAKTSDRLGIATEKLAGLQHAASLAGVENRTLEKSLQNLAVGVSDAADGTGVAKDALLELGLSAGILEQLPLDQQMLEVADAMQGVKNQADKVRIATDLFGARGVSVLNMIGSGSENLTKMAEEAEHLGLAISRVDAAKIEAANDQVTKAKSVFTGLGNQLATAFSPIINEVATSFYQAALDTEGFGNIGQDVAEALVRGFGTFLDTLQMIKHGIMAVELIALKAKKSFQDVFEPSAAMSEFVKQEKQMRIALMKGEMSQKEFTLWQIDAQKRLRDGTFLANGAIKEGAQETQAAIDALVLEMAALTSQALPSDRIELLYNRIIAKAEEAGQAIADNSPAKILEDSAGEGVETVVKKLTFLEKTAIEGSKRRTEFEAKSMTEQTSHVLGELNNQFSGIAANNKKLFALNKAFQIAQAVMQTYQGATLALSSYPPPLSFIMAGAQVASGLGQVAQIRAQSFEGGGFTGRGARSGGMDGKGGFPAMLHPNESVIDHTKGQAGGITIINNVDASGADANVDMKIRAAMQQTSQQTVATIQDLMRRRRFV